MAATTRAGSAATRVFLVVAAAVVVLTAGLSVVLVLDAQRSSRAEAESVTRAVAATIAGVPDVQESVGAADAASVLEPLALRTMRDAGVDFVTIMTPEGIRVTHPDEAQIGKRYIGTIPSRPAPLTEEFTGTLGPSVRTIVPIVVDHETVGWVAVGVTVGTISSRILARLPFAVAIVAVVLLAGIGGALLARRTTRRVAGDLPPVGIRDAVASYESLRTLGEALRAQTHEHGNRMHAAVGLIELGRPEEAAQLLTETSRQSQELVDLVNARRHGDPTVGALLLGKAAQARERGIEWSARIDPEAPRSVLSPVDAVAVVGNLIDNALDAAGSGTEPRWVSVSLTPGEGAGAGWVAGAGAGSGSGAGSGWLALTVADSGPGIPAELRDRIFEHGFSTKPAAAEGRGVGLALVRSLVERAGGTVALDEGMPTTFRILLPEVRR